MRRQLSVLLLEASDLVSLEAWRGKSWLGQVSDEHTQRGQIARDVQYEVSTELHWARGSYEAYTDDMACLDLKILTLQLILAVPSFANFKLELNETQ